jgi:hypothetical protein
VASHVRPDPEIAPRLPGFFARRALLPSLLSGSVASLLLFMAHSDVRNPLEVVGAPRSWLLPIMVLCFSFISLWGLWSWPRVWARTEGPDSKRLRAAIYGWGAFMLICTSWVGALGTTSTPWTTAIQGRDFLADFLVRALIGWPVWLWAGYWWGRLTVGAITRIGP